ncbi:MAG TPA: hypothetical protein VIM98_20210 [Dyella sp.]|uniref:hypothetical protein n=1 Tax=Dyella sp. TaxID=1869338 RepID=UPI002F9400DF
MIGLYLGLLLAGVICFLLHFLAQARIASLLRERHRHEWEIIALPDGQRIGALRVWMRLQLALRSPVLPALEDRAITHWRRVWRYAPWLAWLCWFGALALQWSAR